MVGYFWQQPVDLLTILSGSILASLNSVLHSGASLIHFKCRSNSVTPLLKHTRTFPSQNKIWGLYYGLLMPWMFWYPAISLTSFSTLFFAHFASALLVLLFFKSSLLLPWGLCFGWHGQNCPSHGFPHFVQVTF